ncbi:MAG: tetratricopeptide repeat protein [Myxococcales bacterium]
MGGALLAAFALAAAAGAPLDARELFQRGSAELEKGDAAAAQADFDSAYASQPTPSLLYWRAEARYRSGQREPARKLFEEYLARMPQGPKVAEARARLEELKPRSKVSVGDPIVRRSPLKLDEMVLKPKDRRRAAKKAAPPPATAAATPAPPPAPPAAVAIAPPPPAPAAVAVAPPSPAPRPAPRDAVPAAAISAPPPGHRKVALALAGASVASGAVAGLFALQAHSAAGDVTRAAALHQPFDAERDAEGRRAQTLSLVLAGATVLGAAAAAFLWAAQ